MGRRRALIFSAALVVLGFLPMLVSALAEWIAEANGCLMSEGTRSTCMILGRDMGGVLQDYAIGGAYLMIVTLPIILYGLAGMVCICLYSLWRALRG